MGLPRGTGQPPALAAHPRVSDGAAPRVALLAALMTLAITAAALAALLVHAGLPSAVTGARPSPAIAARAAQSQGRAAAVPLALQGVLSGTVARGSHAYGVVADGAGFAAANPAQSLQVHFSRSGVLVRSGNTTVGLGLRALGYGAALRRVGTAEPVTSANRVLYAHAGVSEWYANGPLGLEQGFTLSRAPAGDSGKPLTLAISLTGNARPSGGVRAGSVSLAGPGAGAGALRYDGLAVSDARGRSLRSWMSLAPGQVLLHVDAAGARYPLRIDPFLQQGPTLSGSGETGRGAFGYSVALSGDGTTALVGAQSDKNAAGAFWVFVRSGESWSPQGGKMVIAGEVGHGQCGINVALSGDGNTALIGCPKDHHGAGAAFVFTRSEGKWTQAAALIGSGEVEHANLGRRVALSDDGDTALVGGYADSAERGAAWVFTRSGESWQQQGSKLTGEGEVGSGQFGAEVALSGDGETALIGGPVDNSGAGAAWVFTRSGEAFTQQGPKLTAAGEAGAANFGRSIALSQDGEIAIISGPNDNGDAGAVWVFERSGEEWTQQGSKLTGAGEKGHADFGRSVAISAEGDTVLVGAPKDHAGSGGAAWLFTRSGETWTQLGEPLTGIKTSGKSDFGRSVALSGDGHTALIGGPKDHRVGSVWVFAE